MINEFKDIDIKHYPYYFSNDVIKIKKHFDANKIDIQRKSYKNAFIYYIGYVAIKDLKYLKINIVNHFYLFIKNLNIYFEEINKKSVFNVGSYQ